MEPTVYDKLKNMPLVPAGSSTPEAERNRMMTLIQNQEYWYSVNMATDDTTALAFYRGVFWFGDTSLLSADGLAAIRNYRSAQNEIFPIVEDIAAAASGGLPQVTMQNDPSHESDGLLRVLNGMVKADKFGETMHQAAIHMLLFRKGGIVKHLWDAERNRVIFRLLFPWEVFFDSSARRMDEKLWTFERVTLPFEVFKERVESGMYDSPSRAIQADVFPRGIADDLMYDSAELDQLREAGLQEFVGIHEFWDFQHGFLYHLHIPTGSVLMKVEIPYDPYTQLVLSPALGCLQGIPLVVLVAPTQVEINVLTNARGEIIRRLQGRTLLDERLFRDENHWNEYLESSPTRPCRVRPPGDRILADSIYEQQHPPLTFDFTRHREDAVDHIRHVAGAGQFRREVENIRTAQEAMMLQASAEGRSHVLADRVGSAALESMEGAARALQWALGAGEAACDAHALWRRFVKGRVDLDPWAWGKLIQSYEWFDDLALLPFSTLMENDVMKRQSLKELADLLTAVGPLGLRARWDAIAEDVRRAFGLAPSAFKTEKDLAAEAAVAAPIAGEEPMPGMAQAMESIPQELVGMSSGG